MGELWVTRMVAILLGSQSLTFESSSFGSSSSSSGSSSSHPTPTPLTLTRGQRDKGGSDPRTSASDGSLLDQHATGLRQQLPLEPDVEFLINWLCVRSRKKNIIPLLPPLFPPSSSSSSSPSIRHPSLFITANAVARHVVTKGHVEARSRAKAIIDRLHAAADNRASNWIYIPESSFFSFTSSFSPFSFDRTDRVYLPALVHTQTYLQDLSVACAGRMLASAPLSSLPPSVAKDQRKKNPKQYHQNRQQQQQPQQQQQQQQQELPLTHPSSSLGSVTSSPTTHSSESSQVTRTQRAIVGIGQQGFGGASATAFLYHASQDAIHFQGSSSDSDTGKDNTTHMNIEQEDEVDAHRGGEVDEWDSPRETEDDIYDEDDGSDEQQQQQQQYEVLTRASPMSTDFGTSAMKKKKERKRKKKKERKRASPAQRGAKNEEEEESDDYDEVTREAFTGKRKQQPREEEEEEGADSSGSSSTGSSTLNTRDRMMMIDHDDDDDDDEATGFEVNEAADTEDEVDDMFKLDAGSDGKEGSSKSDSNLDTETEEETEEEIAVKREEVMTLISSSSSMDAIAKASSFSSSASSGTAAAAAAMTTSSSMKTTTKETTTVIRTTTGTATQKKKKQAPSNTAVVAPPLGKKVGVLVDVPPVPPAYRQGLVRADEDTEGDTFISAGTFSALQATSVALRTAVDAVFRSAGTVSSDMGGAGVYTTASSASASTPNHPAPPLLPQSSQQLPPSSSSGSSSSIATRSAFVVVRPPGHHCGAQSLLGEHQLGFCLLNNVLQSVRYAQWKYEVTHQLLMHSKHLISLSSSAPASMNTSTASLLPSYVPRTATSIPSVRPLRIAIVDIDAHAGNGTEDILRAIATEELGLQEHTYWYHRERGEEIDSDEENEGSGNDDDNGDSEEGGYEVVENTTSSGLMMKGGSRDVRSSSSSSSSSSKKKQKRIVQLAPDNKNILCSVTPPLPQSTTSGGDAISSSRSLSLSPPFVGISNAVASTAKLLSATNGVESSSSSSSSSSSTSPSIATFPSTSLAPLAQQILFCSLHQFNTADFPASLVPPAKDGIEIGRTCARIYTNSTGVHSYASASTSSSSSSSSSSTSPKAEGFLSWKYPLPVDYKIPRFNPSLFRVPTKKENSSRNSDKLNNDIEVDDENYIATLSLALPIRDLSKRFRFPKYPAFTTDGLASFSTATELGTGGGGEAAAGAGGGGSSTMDAGGARARRIIPGPRVLPPYALRNPGGEEWQDLFSNSALPVLESFAPDIVFVSAGFDAHEDDPVGYLNLQSADFQWIGEQLAQLRPTFGIVSVLEGGYGLTPGEGKGDDAVSSHQQQQQLKQQSFGKRSYGKPLPPPGALADSALHYVRGISTAADLLPRAAQVSRASLSASSSSASSSLVVESSTSSASASVAPQISSSQLVSFATSDNSALSELALDTLLTKTLEVAVDDAVIRAEVNYQMERQKEEAEMITTGGSEGEKGVASASSGPVNVKQTYPQNPIFVPLIPQLKPLMQQQQQHKVKQSQPQKQKAEQLRTMIATSPSSSTSSENRTMQEILLASSREKQLKGKQQQQSSSSMTSLATATTTTKKMMKQQAATTTTKTTPPQSSVVEKKLASTMKVSHSITAAGGGGTAEASSKSEITANLFDQFIKAYTKPTMEPTARFPATATSASPTSMTAARGSLILTAGASPSAPKAKQKEKQQDKVPVSRLLSSSTKQVVPSSSSSAAAAASAAGKKSLFDRFLAEAAADKIAMEREIEKGKKVQVPRTEKKPLQKPVRARRGGGEGGGEDEEQRKEDDISSFSSLSSSAEEATKKKKIKPKPQQQQQEDQEPQSKRKRTRKTTASDEVPADVEASKQTSSAAGASSTKKRSSTNGRGRPKGSGKASIEVAPLTAFASPKPSSSSSATRAASIAPPPPSSSSSLSVSSISSSLPPPPTSDMYREGGRVMKPMMIHSSLFTPSTTQQKQQQLGRIGIGGSGGGGGGGSMVRGLSPKILFDSRCIVADEDEDDDDKDEGEFAQREMEEEGRNDIVDEQEAPDHKEEAHATDDTEIEGIDDDDDGDGGLRGKGQGHNLSRHHHHQHHHQQQRPGDDEEEDIEDYVL